MSSLSDFVQDYSVFDLYDKVDGEPKLLTLNEKTEEDGKNEEAAQSQLSGVRRTARTRIPTFKVLSAQKTSSEDKQTPTAMDSSSQDKQTPAVMHSSSQDRQIPAIREVFFQDNKTVKVVESQGKKAKRGRPSLASCSKKVKLSHEESPGSAKSCKTSLNTVLPTPRAILDAWIPNSDLAVDRAVANAMESVCATVALRREVDSAHEESRKSQVIAETLLDDLRKENEAKIRLQNELANLNNRVERAAEYQVRIEKSYELEKENHRIAVERVSVLEKELAEMKLAQEESYKTISEMKLAQKESDKTISKLQADLSYLFGGGLKDLFYKLLNGSEFSGRIVAGLGKAFVLAKEALVDPAKKKLIPVCFEDVRSGHYAFFDRLHQGMSVDELRSLEA